MIIALPTRLYTENTSRMIPLANLCLVAACVLIYPFCDHWYVGPGTGFLSIFTYAFAHRSLWHLIVNMVVLFVIGNAVNRRLGNSYYLVAYFGTVVVMGLVAKFFISAWLVGSSGAIFSILMICLLLMPAASVGFYYVAIFPVTLLLGLLAPPKEPILWLLRGDRFEAKAVWLLLVVPLMEVLRLFFNGLNWTNLGHLGGMVCGFIIVLLLPKRITLGTRSSYGVA